MNNTNFLSNLLSGMSPASKASASAMRRLIEQSNPVFSPEFDVEPPVLLSAAFSLSDNRLFDAAFEPMEGYALIFVVGGHGFLEVDANEEECVGANAIGDVDVNANGNTGEFINGRVIENTGNRQQLVLKNHSLFFFPLSGRFRLYMENGNNPWKLNLLFLSGDSVSYYYKLFSSFAKEAFVLPGSSMFPVEFAHLNESFADCRQDPLWSCEQLTNLLCLAVKEARCHAQSSLPYMIPSYLISIRNSFHKDFARPFSLAMLEASYAISRFRIAHEFTAAFGQSPIAYLNGLRLKKACELLMCGDDRIGEISAAVGFESTNHFINLFRREYGMTPGAYRKRYQSANVAR